MKGSSKQASQHIHPAPKNLGFLLEKKRHTIDFGQHLVEWFLFEKNH
jgi:hypothetical protein